MAATLRVLVADDNSLNRMLMGAVLAPLDVVVDFAEDGAQALAAACSVGYDLIFMDVNMPLMEGPEAVRLLRAFERRTCRPRARIYMVTCNADPDDYARTLECGADGHIEKPVSVDALTELVGTCRADVRSGFVYHHPAPRAETEHRARA